MLEVLSQGVPGRGDVRIVLSVRPRSYRSILHLGYAGGTSVKVPLAGRYTRLLLALVLAYQEARPADPEAPDGEQFRGYVSAAELGELFARVPSSPGPVAEKTVRTYVSEVTKLISAAVRSASKEFGDELPIPDAFSRDDGYRIGEHGLVVAGLDAPPV